MVLTLELLTSIACCGHLANTNEIFQLQVPVETVNASTTVVDYTIWGIADGEALSSTSTCKVSLGRF